MEEINVRKIVLCQSFKLGGGASQPRYFLSLVYYIIRPNRREMIGRLCCASLLNRKGIPALIFTKLSLLEQKAKFEGN